MVRILAFAHHKGGTGKTTACVNVAVSAAARGRRVLVVDLDPQANATAALGVDASLVQTTMYDVLARSVPVQEAVLDTDVGIHLLPSNLDLVALEPWLYAVTTDRARQVADALEPVHGFYDVICVDTPPGAGILMVSGLVAADEVVVALDGGVFAFEELKALDTIVADIAAATGRAPKVARAVIVQREPRPWWRRPDPERVRMAQGLRHRFAQVHEVPFDPDVFESHRRGIPLVRLKPGSAASRSYQRLEQEVFNHV